ncbi:MAG: DUF1232 domain-containing protein [Myxococcaceae bacterium]|nr:DUF1232 domain-containing protein [Myxococcaceae bacterium]MCI0668854.1 DUF1232 domain-containing protein [Myxococcaceae bacterium]
MDQTGKQRGFARKALGYFRDMRVPRWKKLGGLLALVYLFSPVDFVPDLLPVVGWLDDLGVLTATAMFLYKDIDRWRPKVDSLPHRVSGPPQPGERKRSA